MTTAYRPILATMIALALVLGAVACGGATASSSPTPASSPSPPTASSTAAVPSAGATEPVPATDVAPEPVVERPVPTPRANASDQAWAQARGGDDAELRTTLDKLDASLTTLEHAREPWGKPEADLYFETISNVQKLPEASNGLRARQAEIKTRADRMTSIGTRNTDDLTWRLAKERCMKAVTIQDCMGLNSYAKAYPSGRHIREQEQLWNSPRVQALAKDFLKAQAAAAEREEESRQRQCDTCVGGCVGSMMSNGFRRDVNDCRREICRSVCQ